MFARGWTEEEEHGPRRGGVGRRAMGWEGAGTPAARAADRYHPCNGRNGVHTPSAGRSPTPRLTRKGSL